MKHWLISPAREPSIEDDMSLDTEALQVCIAHQIYPLSNLLRAGLRRIFEHQTLALNFVDFSNIFVLLYFSAILGGNAF